MELLKVYGIVIKVIGTVRNADKSVFQGTSTGWYNYGNIVVLYQQVRKILI